MDLDFISHLPENFPSTSRVWIYQADRLFLISEALDMEDMFTDFVASWNSHGTPVKGYANLFFGRFIVIMADETATGVSGCSTDSSVHLIKAIEKKYNVNMFNRQLIAFIVKDKIEQIPLGQAAYALENNMITPTTLYFNNTVLSRGEMESNWIIPASQGWLGKMLNLTSAPAS